MLKDLQIAIVGATGLVGNVLMQLLLQEGIKHQNLHVVSRQKNIHVQVGQDYYKTKSIDEVYCDLYFFCTSSEISQKYIPQIKKGLIIDLSSAFRMHADVPLILPEVNATTLLPENRLIASPNCVVNLIGFVLHLLHEKYTLKRVVGTTYQAISGGGKELLKRFQNERIISNFSTVPLDKNVLCHESKICDTEENEEEQKIQNELSKILQLPKSIFFFSCFRVPVMRSHGVSLNISCEKNPDIQNLQQQIKKHKCFRIISSPPFANPYQASHQHETFISRIRYDHSCTNTISLWIAGDQLLKGAALNAMQIAKKYFGDRLCHSLSH